MARFELTDRFIRNAKPRLGRTEFFDEAVRGLSLRVSETGVKSFCFHYTAGGTRKRLTLGTYPSMGLAKARGLATEARGELEAGRSPHPTTADTLKAICEEYLAREGPRLRTVGERLATFERLVYPTLGVRPIDAIRRIDIARLLDEIEDERGPVMADKTLAFLSRLFSWHASRTEFKSPIVRGMSRSNPRERARDRVLSDDELRAIWHKAEGVFGSFIRFTLLTATRRNEAARMTWAELSGSEWVIPAQRYKTKVDHLIPLSKMALAQLPDRVGEFVFAGLGYYRPKRALDKASGVKGWVLHDLRRSARTLMSRAGINADIAERSLGHTIGGIRGTYDRHQYRDEKAQAFEALASLVDRIVKGKAAEVVPIRQSR